MTTEISQILLAMLGVVGGVGAFFVGGCVAGFLVAHRRYRRYRPHAPGLYRRHPSPTHTLGRHRVRAVARSLVAGALSAAVFVALVVAATVLVAAPAYAAPIYTASDLGTLIASVQCSD